jgi:hypothetical protein
VASSPRPMLDFRQVTKAQSSEHWTLCSLLSSDEIIQHLLLFYPFSREVWYHVLRPAGFLHLRPSMEMTLLDWWLTTRKRVHKDHRKGFDTFFIPVTWVIWKHRNDRVFNNAMAHAAHLASWIWEEGLVRKVISPNGRTSITRPDRGRLSFLWQ